MDKIPYWDQSFSVHIAELDRQHQLLFRTVAELHHALRTGRADSVDNNLIQYVIQYATEHFAAEERLMQQYDFPGLAAHRLEHETFSQKLAEFNLFNLAGKPDVPPHFLTFLQTWLRDHVLKTDKEYSAFLNARGVY